MAKYDTKAKSKIKKVMHEYGQGKLKSGKSGKKVKSQKQAIAIGISEAREAGGKVPKKSTATKKKTTSKKVAPAKKSSAKRSATAKKTGVKKSAVKKK